MSGAVGGECDVWRGIAESGYMPGSAVYALRVALAGRPFGATGQHFDVSLAMARASVAHASAVLVRKRIAADTNLAGKLLSTSTYTWPYVPAQCRDARAWYSRPPAPPSTRAPRGPASGGRLPLGTGRPTGP